METKNPKGSFGLNVGAAFLLYQYLFILLPKNYDYYVYAKLKIIYNNTNF